MPETFLPSKAEAILALNDDLAPFQLSLSSDDVQSLAAALEDTLVSCDRMDFSGGILPKLIKQFAASPYLQQETLAALKDLLLKLEEAAAGRYPREMLAVMLKHFYTAP